MGHEGEFAEKSDDHYGREFTVNHHKLHNDVLFYYLAVKELEAVDKHLDIVIGSELKATALKAYDQHLHSNVFPPTYKDDVSVLVADGHEKVLAMKSNT